MSTEDQTNTDLEDDKEPIKMIAMSERHFEARLIEDYFVGHAGALEELNKKLLEKAGKLFASNEDSLADFTRDLAKEVAEKAAYYRKKQGETKSEYTSFGAGEEPRDLPEGFVLP